MFLVEVVVRDPRTGDGVYKTLELKIDLSMLTSDHIDEIGEAVRDALPGLVGRMVKKRDV